jgi:hypothetical protein
MLSLEFVRHSGAMRTSNRNLVPNLVDAGFARPGMTIWLSTLFLDPVSPS